VTRRGQVGGLKYYIHIGFFPDTMEPGELFVTLGKEGATLGAMADWGATMMSIALQCGADIATLLDKMKGHQFPPADETHSSLIDAIAQDIEEMLDEVAAGRYWRLKKETDDESRM
jgi:ribonucleoside-diphosphate reductase alpha chain